RGGVFRGQPLGDLPPHQLGLGLLGTRLVGLVRLLQALRLRLVRVLVLLEPGGHLLERLLILPGELAPLLRLGLPVPSGLGVSGGVVLPAGLAFLFGDSVGEQLLRLVVSDVEVVGPVVVLLLSHYGFLPLRACKSPGAVPALRGSTAWSGGRLEGSVGVPGLRDQVHQAQLAGPADDEPTHLAPTRLATLRATHGTDGLEQVGAVADREPAVAALRVRQRLALFLRDSVGEQLLRLVVGGVEVVGLVLRVLCDCRSLPSRRSSDLGAVPALRGSTAWSGGRLEGSVGVPGLRDQVHQAQRAGAADDKPAHRPPAGLATLRAADRADRVEQVLAVTDREPAPTHRLALLREPTAGRRVEVSHFASNC